MDLMFTGVMLDAGRCLEKHHYYRHAIDFAAQRGLNTLLWHFADDQGCAMRFDSIPDIESPHAFTKTEMRSLVAFARSRGVNLIPELATLGHTAYLTRLPRYRHLAESDQMFSCICPVAPETRPLLTALLEETCDVFDSPVIHAGLDESNFGHHPLTAEAIRIKGRTDIFAEHILFVHDVLTRRGRQMWMWADGLLHDQALADQLPRDIVQCNWRYRPEEPLDTTQGLIDRGYDVVLCSASISSQQMLFPGEQFALPNLRSLHQHETLKPAGRLINGRGRVIGRINTVWTPVRYIADSLWLGLDLAFAVMRDGSLADLDARINAFGLEFYGLTDVVDWNHACQIVLQQSPLRDEWLAAITMQPTDTERFRDTAMQWKIAAEKLSDISSKVKHHRREFDAFLLLVQLAELAYSLSSTVEQMTAEEASHAAEQWQAMITRVDQQWDIERFSDDPRKYAAPIAHYEGDHLIPMMSRGLDRLTARAEAMESVDVR